MTKRFRTNSIKIFAGILMPVFLSILIPQTVFASNSKVSAFVISTTDPYFTTDVSLEDKQWYLPKIHAHEAWDYVTGSNNVIVAVVDTGIHASHVELNDGRVIEGYNAITKEIIPANFDSDDNGHGTAVSGVIGAIPNNLRGISGVNWTIKLMPIKALHADGTGDLAAVADG